ncbi:hypothetical protein [Streptomyces sp. SID13031]|uniref:hypothetical protein n=1 Tax=Streptomyces sp. SID13031 TaxID=2706046 RepID=UPI0013C6F78C|nr:hypothetical protein [Streptomyces sp. SID13031]NEA34234.1 hypothetical protein [Streptomyces sp. SID13031]
MATKRSLVSLTIAAVLALAATSCFDPDQDSGKSGASPPTSTSSTPPPSSTPAPSTPSVTQSAPPAATARTKAELTKALLVPADIPSGFSVDPSIDPDDSKLSSSDARCKELVLLFNAKTPPGVKAVANRSFTGGQQGPFFDEELDAMGSPAAATALLTRTKAAIKSCKSAKLTIPGVGASTMVVSEISVPAAGSNPVGGRFTANGGALNGVEIIFAFVGVGDVVLTMSFDSGDQVDGALGAAAVKAKKMLGTAKTGT